MIPSRQQQEVIDMLRKFKKVETITRDFSKTYKAAINEALPKAKQIVDRFHILKNLTDDISDYLKRTIEDKIKISDTSLVPLSEKAVLNERERKKVETGLRKWEVVKEVQRLKKLGKNNAEISKILQVSRPTVIRYLNLTKPPIASRPCKLDPYVERIKELILNGYNYKQIFYQIQEEGYTGQISLCNSKLKGIRWEAGNKVRYVKRSDIKKLLYNPIGTMMDEQKRKDIVWYLKKNTELAKVLELVSDFKIVLLGKNECKLQEWIKEAEKYQIIEIKRFLKLIRADIESVKNAIIYHYSNGLTEGHNNKIKVIKRQMYGRCKFALLRLKILC